MRSWFLSLALCPLLGTAIPLSSESAQGHVKLVKRVDHIIQPGEYAWLLTEKYGITWDQLVKANPSVKNWEWLQIGAKISIPSTSHTPQSHTSNGATASSASHQQTEKKYTVKSGDYPHLIATNFGISLDALFKANPQIDWNIIHPGTVVNIPSKSTTPPSEPSPKPSQPNPSHGTTPIVCSKSDFTVLSSLGQGGAGSVFKVKSNLNGKYYALKSCNWGCATEIEILAKMSSSGVTPALYGYGAHKDFIVMDIVEGSTLTNLKGLTKADFGRIARQLVQAVKLLHHAGYAHMDLHFGNFFQLPNQKLMMIDFSGSHRLGTSETVYDGWNWVMAPETRKMPQGARTYSDKSDVWSLGVDFYTLWTTIHKFTYSAPDSAVPANGAAFGLSASQSERAFMDNNQLYFGSFFPEALKTLITQMTALHPSQRPSLSSVEAALAQF
jgi:LysM repeat protein/predicted Ser/Thr protein kinase